MNVLIMKRPMFKDRSVVQISKKIPQNADFSTKISILDQSFYN